MRQTLSLFAFVISALKVLETFVLYQIIATTVGYIENGLQRRLSRGDPGHKALPFKKSTQHGSRCRLNLPER
uniref:Putative secreted protein n=1 Tax=Panstrongylus lignarius TaxID=156445 RepID=A0A224Y6F5_9HEMI